MYSPSSPEPSTGQRTVLKTPVRNRYFYGKLLDAYHFQLETNYLNAKRWLLNRLISGYGVVCGLDVTADNEGVVVTPGVAIDKWGREIIVPHKTTPLKIPPELIPKAAPNSENSEKQEKRPKNDSEKYVHLLLCYHECESDPAPVLSGGCGTEPCEPGAIRERYRLVFKDGASAPISTQSCMPDFISGDRIDYPLLAKYVTRDCPKLPENPCIPLANIKVSAGEGDPGCPHDDDIDITIRPIVFTNDLLFELLLSLLHEDTYRRVK